MQHRARIIWGAIAGLVAGVALGALLFERSEPSPGPPIASGSPLPSDTPDLQELREALEALRRERDALAAQVATLQGRRPGTETKDADAADATGAGTGNHATGVPAFDEAWLSGAGYVESDIARLRERWDTLELDRLYLADLARREGWHGSRRFRDQIQQLHEQLREEIGENEYDVLLYAAGRHNRVVVSDVLESSPAAAAGIEDGDVIRSYGGRFLYEVGDLIRSTGAGQPGRSTEVRVIRAGEELRFFVPRGPLGVRARRDRGAPDTLR